METPDISLSTQDIIHAWRDQDYFDSLSVEQRAQLPNNPIGDPLSQEELVRHAEPKESYTDEYLSPCCQVTSGYCFTFGGQECTWEIPAC